ncbi:MAG: DEAD/DEAH box helicase [Ruminococcaceae bacterium]|nr:DEAD/DEAH box helicase [Oscillospiraceae bacterium]
MRETLESIRQQRGWHTERMTRILDNLCGRLFRRLPQGATLSLTDFQKTAIQHPRFWRDWSEDAPVENLMVQGATSAGKTLVSELATLDTAYHNKKTVVLVPLKAMVHERTRQFREDMGYGLPGYELNVFGSSSDYMENDEQIIAGDYDVAVIVYEKFFAMLSQGNARVMDNCGLLIVDELSMLSLEQRGPKLEMALEIVRSRFPQTRIFCLATCDCSTEKICRWLNIDEPIISTARPVALEEHILRLNGTGRYRLIPANHNSLQGDIPDEFPEEIQIAGYQPDARPDEKVKKLLLATLTQLYRELPDARVLVFAGTQNKAAYLADFLMENQAVWAPSIQPPDQELTDALQGCDRDEGQEHLLDALLPAGIAYHHAGLSASLREIIEEQFQRPQSGLRVIVATETLTVGVNMPFDAMIMTGARVPRGMGELTPLSPQEYRNYIGRAGRLGQSNRMGKTYLFVEDGDNFERYWDSYFRREEIETALSKANEEALAPYYLSLINNKVGTAEQNGRVIGTAYTLRQLEVLFERSLAKACGAKSFSARELQDKLYWAYLSDKAQGGTAMGRGEVAEDRYAIAPFGAHMAPYAFSVDTCIRIFYFFYEGYKNGGLKLDLTREEITSDRYLLDILYHVCCHREIVLSSNVTYPQGDRNPSRTFQARARVLEQLRELVEMTDEEGKPRYALWCEGQEKAVQENNDLWLLLNSSNIPDEGDKLQAALRAIVLFYWTQGYPVERIKRKTGFHQFTKLIAGDIERLAEMAAFHLDAIYKCLSTAGDPVSGQKVFHNDGAVRAFYEMQTRVKYGMPRELAKLANKHIHGLDRKRLLLLQQQASEANLSLLQYLCITPPGRIPPEVLTTAQHTQLLFAVERQGNAQRIEAVMKIVQDEAGVSLDEEERNSLYEIANWGDPEQSERSPRDIYLHLKKVLSNKAFGRVNLYTEGDYSHMVWVAQDGDRQYRLHIGVLGEDTDDESLKEFFHEDAYANLLVVPHKFTSEQMNRVMTAHGVPALVNNMYLTYVLAKTLLMPVDDGVALTAMLGDLRGSFTMADYRYFPLMNFLRWKERPESTPAFRILFGSGGEHRGEGFNPASMARALTANGNLGTCEILPWGDALVNDEYNVAACPTVLTVTRRDVVRSESLTRFVYRMRNQQFRHCLLIMESPEDEAAWNSPERLEEYGNKEWSPQFASIRKMVVGDERTAQERIREYVESWSPSRYLVGISYAHYTSVPGLRDSACQNDCDRLRRLADALAQEFGEDRIFFDQFYPAREVFWENRNAERSLAAYEECLANVVLWNFWTKENANCRRECEVILRRSQADEAYCLFLKPGDPRDPELPSDAYYSERLTDDNIPRIVERLRQEVQKRINRR